jgi:carbon storage regulator
MIGDDIVITICDIRGDKVRVGIDAPNHISVHRQEVFEAIKRSTTDVATVAVVNETKTEIDANPVAS